MYLWGIPRITLSTPHWLDLSTMVFRAGMSDSQPSKPKRFSEDHFLWRNSSNLPTVVTTDASQNFISRLWKWRTSRLTWWHRSFYLAKSSSLPWKTAWFREFQTFVESTGTAPCHLWTWTPPRYADSRPSKKTARWPCVGLKGLSRLKFVSLRGYR